ncbi:MAG: hypothetical protein ACYDCO_06145 [Armatimonadota bacterium]
MTGPARTRRGCSPWAYLGCGCGMLSMIGILFIFFTLGALTIRERTDPRWNMKAYDRCVMNLRNLGRAIASYRQDHHGALPADLAELQQHYISSPDWLRCPLAERGIDTRQYLYTPASKDAGTPLITCLNHAHGPVVLLHNGLLRLPEDAVRGVFRKNGKAAKPAPEKSYD